MSDDILRLDINSPYDEQIVFNVLTTEGEGGREYRYNKWQYPKRIFDITLKAKNESDINHLWDFYKSHAGNYDTFLWENPNDSASGDSVTADIFATGDGVTANFYIGNKFLLPTGDCYLIPNTYSVEYSVGGTGDYSEWTEDVDYTITSSLGQVNPTVTLASGDTLRATYRFYYRVRFKDARLSKTAFAYQLWQSDMQLIQII